MKLILTQPEIEQILRDHITKTITLATGNNFAIDFVATRSDAGITATIDIPYMGVTALPEVAAAAKDTPPFAVETKTTGSSDADAVARMDARNAAAASTENVKVVTAPDTKTTRRRRIFDAAPIDPPAPVTEPEPSGDELEHEAASPEVEDIGAGEALAQAIDDVNQEAEEVQTPPPAPTERKSLFTSFMGR
jgi:hypothetical protein